MLKAIAATFLAGITLLLQGCVIPQPHSAATLAIPPANQDSYEVTKSTVILVRLVIDERMFGQGAGDPMMLSLLRENAGGAPAEAWERIYARKRVAVGKPLENVLLEEGQPVARVVRDNLVAAFRLAGFRTTTNAAEAGASPMVVDVHIKRFWAWYDRRVDHDTLDAMIETTLYPSVSPAPAVVTGHAEYVVGREDAASWVEVLNRALADYRAQVGVKFAYLP